MVEALADLVMRVQGGKPLDALKWLSACLGVTLSKKPRKGAKAGSSAPAGEDGAPAPAAEGQSTPSTASGEEGGLGEPPPPADGGGAAGADGAPEDPQQHWRKRLLFAKGALQDCRENVFYMLSEHPRLKGLVALDLFAHRIIKTGAPPWDSEPGEWTTHDDYELGLWLASRERLVIKGEGVLAAGVAMAANRARFHPVRDWLTGLKWDGVERLSHWLIECLGAADKTYHRMVGTFFMQGMVARILDPGCHKDALLNLAGVLVYEVAELDSFNKAEVTAVKQYVSGRVDRVREPYTRRPVDRPRSCVLAGTTNQHEYFKDPTGSRRFWPVAIPGAVDLQKLREWREQLFAEAVHRYREGERHYPTRDEEREFFWPEQDQREIADPWFERVAMWLEAEAQEMKNTFLGSEILQGALHVPADRIDGARNMATRVGVIMHKLGWGKARDATGARLWRYVRPKPGAASPAAPVGPVGQGGAEQGASGGPTPAWSADDFTGVGDA